MHFVPSIRICQGSTTDFFKRPFGFIFFRMFGSALGVWNLLRLPGSVLFSVQVAGKV